MNKWLITFTLALVIFTSGCASEKQNAPDPIEANASTSEVNLINLKYKLREKVGDPYMCDSPVQRADNAESYVDDQFANLMQEDEFQSILENLHLALTPPWSEQEKLLVIQEYNILSQITLEKDEPGYKFSIMVPNDNTVIHLTEPPQSNEQPGPQQAKNVLLVSGNIDIDGTITITTIEPSFYECP